MSEHIMVIGAGTMGHGIAQVAATSGFRVTLVDIEEPVLQSAMARVKENLAKAVERKKLAPEDADAALARLTTATQIEPYAADVRLAIEAVPEKMDLKAVIFRRLSQAAPPDAILASNTSSLSITEIAAITTAPERVIGMHFFNPPYIMRLLELVKGYQTSDATIERCREIGRALGKEIIVVSDSPGFATSRLGIALGMEAIRMLEEGVASAEDIDRAMELGYNHPMGPLKLTDLVGLDVRLHIAEYLHRELGMEQFRPPRLLRKMVLAGKLGKKSGEGFYKYS